MDNTKKTIDMAKTIYEFLKEGNLRKYWKQILVGSITILVAIEISDKFAIAMTDIFGWLANLSVGVFDVITKFLPLLVTISTSGSIYVIVLWLTGYRKGLDEKIEHAMKHLYWVLWALAALFCSVIAAALATGTTEAARECIGFIVWPDAYTGQMILYYAMVIAAIRINIVICKTEIPVMITDTISGLFRWASRY